MNYFNSFWHIIWTMFWVFAFCAYLIALFSIITDLFRDRGLKGWMKAIWLVCLFFLPFATALAYLIFRGRGMSQRSVKQAEENRQQAESYIRDVAGSSASDEIAKAKGLLDAGTITQQEYEQLKARALAGEAKLS
ncbi:hypothetical protein FOE78_08385 [Microlunatus elymi]|uniref:Phospholipase_D-nuclease N-terminal n=1 Tax=Microlunatus elymi TaxID=2596828 RepID=A0A516PXN5_9ACTN|nr:SHOCT domain-containing protein [Microlunatus elymi]QDP95912.1 hypothetical protein FOE78_08385 [Microlunatus elymi]